MRLRLAWLLLSIIVTFISQLQVVSKKIIKVGHAAGGSGRGGSSGWFFWFRDGLLGLLFLLMFLLRPRGREMSLAQRSSTCNDQD